MVPYTELINTKMTVKEIAQKIANKAGMPYCWEDIMYRIMSSKPLPFKLSDGADS